MKFPEHVERARELSRDVNILNLENKLTREMVSIGFSRIYDSDLTSFICSRGSGHTYHELEFMDMGGFYFPEGFHDEADRLMYRNDRTTVLIRKRRIQELGYWEKYWGVNIAFKFDLSNVPDLTEDQAKTLPLNQRVLSNLGRDYEGFGAGNAFEGHNATQEHFPIIYNNGNLTYHQLLGFARQSGLEGKAKDEFIAKVVETIRNVTFVNNAYVQNQLEVWKSLEKHKQAFELILKS